MLSGHEDLIYNQYLPLRSLRSRYAPLTHFDGESLSKTVWRQACASKHFDGPGLTLRSNIGAELQNGVFRTSKSGACAASPGA